MKVHRYSKWDATQAELSLDAADALDALADVMMHGLSPRDAMQYLERFGFELAGKDFRVLGSQELSRELRKQAHELYEGHKLDDPFAQLRERLQQLQAIEQQTLRERHGYESRAMNEFLERRHAPAANLSQAIARFEDYDFQDDDARERYDELRSELPQLRELERFTQEQGARFRGRPQADYETAQALRKRLQTIEAITQAIEAGELGNIDTSQLAELLGDGAARSLMILRDLPSRLADEGYLREQGSVPELTAKAVRRIGQRALADVYTMLRKGRSGEHGTSDRGAGSPRPDETHPYQFGDAFEIDVTKTVLNALRSAASRAVSDPHPRKLRVSVSDVEVREHDFSTDTTTVLLLDLSWSMSFEGRFPAAKRVALAMDHLIRTQFPRDRFFIVGFSTRARELSIAELPAVSWDPSDPFTNLQEGLQLAERLIAAHPSRSPQVLVITDGQPTAYCAGNELHVEWPSGYGGISPNAVAYTLEQVHRITRRGVVINTFMLHDSPELVGFVERMTEINHGRALFTDPSQLGSYVMVDHLNQKRRSRARS